MSLSKKIYFAIAILLFLLIILLPTETNAINFMAACAVLMGILWIGDVVPVAVTSLLPLILYPILDIMPISQVASEYMNSTIFLFMGGFLLAIAMEKHGLHNRIASSLIKLFGNSYGAVFIGFLLSSYLFSMIINNTSTTIILLPLALSILKNIPEANNKNFQIAILLGIAYASSIGGISTLIGTVPNLILSRIYNENFQHLEAINFFSWLKIALPISILMLICLAFVLSKVMFKFDFKRKMANVDQGQAIGKITRNQLIIGFGILTTSLLWLFRNDIIIDRFVINGWSNYFEFGKNIDDGAIAILFPILFFFLPTKGSESKALLEGSDFAKIPWEVLLLFGGGFALAKGFQVSGLSEYLGNAFVYFKEIPVWIIVASIALMITFLTEFTSNTATVNTILPILVSLSIAIEIDPRLLMIPATISASFAFMLPVATPPNAIVFGSGLVEVKDMVKAGFLLNIIGAVIVTLLCLLLIN